MQGNGQGWKSACSGEAASQKACLSGRKRRGRKRESGIEDGKEKEPGWEVRRNRRKENGEAEERTMEIRCDDKGTKTENIERQEGLKEGRNKRKPMSGFCSFIYSFLIQESF